MGPAILIDTNAVIELVGGLLPAPVAEWLEAVMTGDTHHVSVVTCIELFSKQLGPAETATLEGFVQFTNVIGLEESIIQRTIALRQQRKMKLPDALIAATALVYGLLLVTRNSSDFKNIPGLSVLNPHAVALLPPLQ